MRLNSRTLIYNDMGSSTLYYLTYLIKHPWRVKFLCHLKIILITLYLNCINFASNRTPSFHPVISMRPLMVWFCFKRCHEPRLWSPAALHGPQQCLCHRPNKTSSCQPPTDCSTYEQSWTSSLQNGLSWYLISQKHSSEHQLSIVFGLFIYFKHVCLKNSGFFKDTYRIYFFLMVFNQTKPNPECSISPSCRVFPIWLDPAIISDCYLSNFFRKKLPARVVSENKEHQWCKNWPFSKDETKCRFTAPRQCLALRMIIWFLILDITK